MTSRRLSELTASRIDSGLSHRSVVVLPLGAVEQHGPHLPVGTDLLIADELAARVVDAAEACGVDAWCLPALAFTKSDEHDGRPGTFWLSAEDLLRTVAAIARGVAATPARTLVFYNAHGGNAALLQVALRQVRRETGLGTFLVQARFSDDDGPEEHGFGIHAGHAETSVMLALRPDLVDLDRAARCVPDRPGRFATIGFNDAPVAFGWVAADFSSTGVIGDPTCASAEAGHKLISSAVADGVAALRAATGFWS